MSIFQITRGAPSLLEEVLPVMRAAAAERRSVGAFGNLDGARAYLKGEPMHGKARLRYGLRFATGQPVPRLREYDNLSWLRSHGFHAVEPLTAGVFWRAGLPSFQFLATRATAGTQPLREYLATARPAVRTALAILIGRETARLHAARFIHRDLHPRNLLIDERAGTPRLVFLDAWRGGLQSRLVNVARGPDYDLACFLLHGVEILPPEDIQVLLDAYFDGCQTPSTERERRLRRVERHRSQLAARLERRGRAVPDERS